jgi:hypothetical protein
MTEPVDISRLKEQEAALWEIAEPWIPSYMNVTPTIERASGVECRRAVQGSSARSCRTDVSVLGFWEVRGRYRRVHLGRGLARPC